MTEHYYTIHSLNEALKQVSDACATKRAEQGSCRGCPYQGMNEMCRLAAMRPKYWNLPDIKPPDDFIDNFLRSSLN